MLEQGDEGSRIILEQGCNEVIVRPREHLSYVIDEGPSRLAFDLGCSMGHDHFESLRTVLESRAGRSFGALFGTEVVLLLQESALEQCFEHTVVVVIATETPLGR